jgi:hypothetical protein
MAILQLATGLGIMVFWAAFFTIGLAPQNPPRCYLAFEHAFVLPDVVVGATLIVSSALLRRGNPLGLRLALVSAGAIIFLGLVDISFNIQNGIYGLSTADAALNGFINLWCLVLGGLIIRTVGPLSRD